MTNLSICFCLLFLLLGGCGKIQHENSIVRQNCRDDGLRGFLGVHSTEMTIRPSNQDIFTADIFYVHAIARFEKGKCVGLDKISNGIINAGQTEARFEIVWGRQTDQFGYSFLSNESSYYFEAAPFYEHLKNGGRASSTIAVIRQRNMEYRGMKILTLALSSAPKELASVSSLVSPTPNMRIEDVLKDVDFSALILFKECKTIQESQDFLHVLKNRS